MTDIAYAKHKARERKRIRLIRRARRRNERCAICDKPSTMYRCPDCSFARKLAEAINTINPVGSDLRITAV